MLIEVIVTNVEDAIVAEQYGADRLELIHGFDLGGLSPQLSLSKTVCDAVDIPVNIMLRPHGNSFNYTKTDIQQIMQELEYLRDHTQANAVVFGALDEKNNLNLKLLEQVLMHKGNLGLTFHRAIDNVNDILSSYKELLNYTAIDLILTSGGKNTAIEGAAIIKQMVELSKRHCQILAGSGITPDNAKQIVKLTGVEQIHIGSGVRDKNVVSQIKLKQLMHNLFFDLLSSNYKQGLILD